MASNTYEYTGTILGKTWKATVQVTQTGTYWRAATVYLQFATSTNPDTMWCTVWSDYNMYEEQGPSTTSGCGFYASGGYYGRFFNVGTQKAKSRTGTQTYRLDFILGITSTSGKTDSVLKHINITIPAQASYSVQYDANGGSGTPSAQTKWEDEPLTLATSSPSRTGYAFWHWNTSTDNGGTSYDPGGTYTANAAATLHAIWNPLITYSANGSGVGNMPVNQTKTYGVATSLGSNVPTRTGYQFDGWYTNASGTGTKYEPGQSIAAGSNSSLALYAKWLKVPDPPRISSMSVIRCDSSGTADDEGTYGRVAVEWSVDTTSDTVPDNTGAVTGTIRADGGSSERAIAFSSGASGTSGTAVAIVDSCDIDTQYLVTVTVTDKVTTTIRNDLLTRAKFVLDFRRGGNAMGIGSAAPVSGLEVGWDAQFDGDVTVLGDIEAANLTPQNVTTVSDVISASGTWTVSNAAVCKWGHLCFLYLDVKNSQALAAGSTSNLVGTVSQAYRPKSIVSFGCRYGGGWMDTSGGVYFTPHVDVSADSSFYISCTYYV